MSVGFFASRRRGVATATASFGLMLLAGCSGGGDANPYEARFAQAMAETDNEFVRGVLSDGKITAPEVQEAEQRALDCMTAAGVSASFDADEYGQIGLVVTGNLSPTQNSDLASCTLEWSNAIVGLYNDMSVNPSNADLDDLVASCLVRKGLAPEGFTGSDYRELASTNVVTMTLGPDDVGIVPLSSDAEPEEILLPGGQPLDEGEALRCMRAPLQ